jgi:ABC-2 type transport system permease protein
MRKEFLIVVMDKRARLVLVIPPLIQLVIFTFATTLEVRNVSFMVFNEDGGSRGIELVGRITAAKAFEKAIHVYDFKSAERALDRGEILFAVRIPADFSRKVERGEGAKIQVIHDGRRSNSAQIADGYLNQIIRDYSLEISGQRSLADDLTVRNFYNQNLDNIWTTIPSLVAILTLIMTLAVSSASLAREKELGTFDELMVTPHRPFEILTGKFVPAMIVGTAEALLIYAFGRLIFGAPFRGSFPLLLLSILCFSYGVVGFGLLISVLSNTQQQAILGSFMVIVPAVALSGFAAPADNMPEWLQKAAWINPMKHGIFIFKGIFLKDLTLREVLAHAWPFLHIGTVPLLLARWFFVGRSG